MGQLVRWNHERGYGFIKEEETGDEDLFAHVTALVEGEGSVKEGDLVTYMKDFVEKKGKYQAMEIKYAGEGPPLYAETYDDGSSEGGEEAKEEEEAVDR